MIDLLSLKETREHFPVMICEIINNLNFEGKNIILDCTFGAGGYSSFILQNKDSKVIALDRDNIVEVFADKLKKQYKDRFSFHLSKFSNFPSILDSLDIKKVDAIIMDLGFSNMQIQNKERGFSFQKEGNLAMTMGLNETDAFEFINFASEKLIADVIYYYGEERFAKRIAKTIINERRIKEISTTLELADLIKKIIPFNKKKKIHPATKTFQAIRIYINRELEELEKALDSSLKYLNKGGKILVVSFHSLEDKIVKNFFKSKAIKVSNNKYNKEFTFYKQNDDINSVLKIITKKPIVPKEEEIKINPPSSSAKLRIAEVL